MENEKMSVYQLVGIAMGKIGAITKDSTATNANGNRMYNFRGIDDVYNALNPVMAELGLFVAPKIIDQRREERKTASGGLLLYTILTVEYTMYAPDGSNITMTVVGEAMDSGDKSTNKAMSAALKYAMFQLFMIPTEELKDPDADVYDDVLPKAAQMPKFTPPASEGANTQVNVQTRETVPPVPSANDVQAYIKNEMGFMANLLEFTEWKQIRAWFAEARKALIEAKVVPDIPAQDLNMDQAKDLIAAIYDKFFTDKNGEKK